MLKSGKLSEHLNPKGITAGHAAARDRLLLQGPFVVSPYAHFSSEASDSFDPTAGGLNYRTATSATASCWALTGD